MNIYSKIHQTELPFQDFVKNIMSRRVRQGHPEEITFNGTCKAYAWTDGVDSYISIFSPLGEKLVQEISIS